MSKKIGILAMVLVIAICFFTISAFAGENSGSSQLPFVESDEILPENPDIQTEADLIEEFEKMFGEGSGKIINIAIIGVAISMLFFPALIVVIVFDVLNRKTKKKIKEYERFFGAVPQNAPVYFNPDMNNAPYGASPLNPTGAPIGNSPTVNPYNTQNDINNQQGGQL